MYKIMKYWYNRDEQKIAECKHLIMLDLKTEELERLSKGDGFVKEFNEKITELNEKETFQSAMTYEEDQRLILNTEKSISFNEGIEQGIEKGSKDKQIEIAKSMLKKGMKINLISEITGLLQKEIEELSKE